MSRAPQGSAPPAAAILGCAGPELSAAEAAFFRDADPFGFILFARNVEGPAQVRRLVSDLRSAVGRDVPVLVDQEGGRVQRLRPPHWRDWLPPLDQSDRMLGGPLERSFWLRCRIVAAELAALGIDTCCSPSGDIATAATHPFLKNRCLGRDAETVIRAARASAEGLLAGGVLPVLKHLPGHGRATADSHHEPPRVSAAPEVLGRTDFAVFAALSDLPLAMTGHVVFDRIDPAAPATTSPALVALIRDRIGFGGLLMTDDLSMEALGGSIGDRAEAAIAAGCDVVLHCNGRPDEMEEALQGAGRMTPGAVARAGRALALRRAHGRAHGRAPGHAPGPADLAALDDEFRALMAGQEHG